MINSSSFPLEIVLRRLFGPKYLYGQIRYIETELTTNSDYASLDFFQ